MLECVVNVSEGRRPDVVAELAANCGICLLDIHCDPHHNRSVLTLAGPTDLLVGSVRALAAATVARLDLAAHEGVHPRIGVLDVVPWVALTGGLAPAVAARDDFAEWAGGTLDLPCFLYGPLSSGHQRSLPEVRRHAWISLGPDRGPKGPHPSAGATAVGARPPLVAYNVWLAHPDLERARAVAAELRSPAVRALGLAVGEAVQVSFNLIDADRTGPAAAYDAVASRTDVARAELVGLVPASVFDAIPAHRGPELDLDRSRTIEARLEQAGLDGGS